MSEPTFTNFMLMTSKQCDYDETIYLMGVQMGAFGHGTFLKHRSVYWTKNSLGDSLWDAVKALVDEGLLLKTEEDSPFIWNVEDYPIDA